MGGGLVASGASVARDLVDILGAVYVNKAKRQRHASERLVRRAQRNMYLTLRRVFFLKSRRFRFVVDPGTNVRSEGFSAQRAMNGSVFVWDEASGTRFV